MRKIFRKTFVSAIKGFVSATPFRGAFFPSWRYMFNPAELIFMCELLKETSSLDGSITEIGCADGATTIFLNRFLDTLNLETREYMAIDTFSGFIPEHVNYEYDSRGVERGIITGFDTNSEKFFKKTLKTCGVTRVKTIRADATKFDFSKVGKLSFSLIDVDLYLPVKDLLPKIYGATQSGGVIVVDDCTDKSTHWNGAYQAYREFIQSLSINELIVGRKLGVIRK